MDDNSLDQFVLQRKDAPNKLFRSMISASIALGQPSFIDTTIQAGQTYWYRAAAITVFGDTSEFSAATEVMLPASAPEPVCTFYVRNISLGIEVSWPSATTDT